MPKILNDFKKIGFWKNVLILVIIVFLAALLKNCYKSEPLKREAQNKNYKVILSGNSVVSGSVHKLKK